MASVYQGNFYTRRDTATHYSAERVLGTLWQYVQPQRVVDMGCGVGSWLNAAKQLGAKEVLGIEGDWLDPAKLAIAQEEFLSFDLTKPLTLDQTYDLAISLEVGEHFDRTYAEQFVANLTQAAPLVLFSAAIPFQRGVHHVNEQWPSYWRDLFAQQGYVLIDCIRPAVWNDPEVKVWYAQNAFVYVKESHLADHPALADKFDPNLPMLDAVHPRMYQRQVKLQQPQYMSYKQTLLALPQMTVDALKRALGGPAKSQY